MFFSLQDVESYDPILNPVLNREVRKTGGRVLITLGDQDIDLSPSFTIFLSTRDPSVSLLSQTVLNQIVNIEGHSYEASLQIIFHTVHVKSKKILLYLVEFFLAIFPYM